MNSAKWMNEEKNTAYKLTYQQQMTEIRKMTAFFRQIEWNKERKKQSLLWHKYNRLKKWKYLGCKCTQAAIATAAIL